MVWDDVAERAVHALGVPAGASIAVRDRAARPEALVAVLAALARHDLTPSLEMMPNELLLQVLEHAPLVHLQAWDRHRSVDAERVAGALRLAGGDAPDLDHIDPVRRSAWQQAVARVEQVIERRGLPVVVLAVPTIERARSIGCDLATLDDAVLPALAVPSSVLGGLTSEALAIAQTSTELVIRSPGCELTMSTAGRTWMRDVGHLTDVARAEGATVVNLPSGSIYSTVVERSVEGTVRIDALASCRDLVLTFTHGRITDVTVAGGDVGTVEALFDTSSGEARRISHVGIGLNPAVGAAARGWVLVEENASGSVYVALGENRYLGGANESSLNVDVVVSGGSLWAGDRRVHAALS
jgi:leucyl aminopeptidase (aminopeptidase T)